MLLKIVIFYLTLASSVGYHQVLNVSKAASKELLTFSIYENYLSEIQKESAFDAMLIVQEWHSYKLGLDAFHKFPVPKVSLKGNQRFKYKSHYNSEILTVVIMTTVMELELLQQTAQMLDDMRQIRILAVAINVGEVENFKNQLLRICESYHMTRVLLIFDQANAELIQQSVVLKPYPEYHWELFNMDEGKNKYFPVHWRNLHNKSLITYTHHFIGRSIIYEDSEGNIQMSGFVVRFVQLFAERFNASLEMFQPLKAGGRIHISILAQMTRDEKLDLPMILDAGHNNGSYYLELNQMFIVVPCAQPLTTREVFHVLLSVRFFGCVVGSFLILAILYSLLDNTVRSLCQRLNIILNVGIFLGVLGQPFAMPASRLASVRMVYFIIGIVGLNISSLFAGYLNTFLTHPPYHKQIETISDFIRSPLKILMYSGDLQAMGADLKLLEGAFAVHNDSAYVAKKREGFNTSFGYYTTTSIWNIQSRQQYFFSQKSFCTFPNMTVYPLLVWSIPLPANSPYKEALNSLVHRVHEIGLITAWDSSTFLDMRQLKQVSLRDPDPRENRKVLQSGDFFWIWMVIVIGLACSFIVFVVELCVGRSFLKNIFKGRKSR